MYASGQKVRFFFFKVFANVSKFLKRKKIRTFKGSSGKN